MCNLEWMRANGRSDAPIGVFIGSFEVARAMGEDLETRFANAQLIAASPALLKACKDMLEAWRHYQPHHARQCQEAQAASDAIAKAEGRLPAPAVKTVAQDAP
jgi:hypothetical protein